MRIELNDKEYTYALGSKSSLKCDICAWKTIQVPYCVKFCRIGYVFRTGEITPSIFHL